MPTSPTSLLTPPANPQSSSDVASTASTAATNLSNTGTNLVGQGESGLQPVITRLMSLLQGGGAVDQATQPQTTSILKQYDTARRTSANFTPRGGGQVSSINNLNTQQAGQIADTKASAVDEASKQLGALMAQITGQGLQAQSQGASDFQGLLRSAMAGENLKWQHFEQIGKVVGALAATYFTGGAAAPLVGMALSSGGSGDNAGPVSDPSGGSGVGPGMQSFYGAA